MELPDDEINELKKYIRYPLDKQEVYQEKLRWINCINKKLGLKNSSYDEVWTDLKIFQKCADIFVPLQMDFFSELFEVKIIVDKNKDNIINFVNFLDIIYNSWIGCNFVHYKKGDIVDEKKLNNDQIRKINSPTSIGKCVEELFKMKI